MRVLRPHYSAAFKTEAVVLAERGDRSFRALATDLGVSEWTLRHWYNQAQMAKRPLKKKRVVLPVPKDETAQQKVERLERELTRLQRENDSLKMDREILKKAAAFFAKESE
jgi:transposase